MERDQGKHPALISIRRKPTAAYRSTHFSTSDGQNVYYGLHEPGSRTANAIEGHEPALRCRIQGRRAECRRDRRLPQAAVAEVPVSPLRSWKPATVDWSRPASPLSSE